MNEDSQPTEREMRSEEADLAFEIEGTEMHLVGQPDLIVTVVGFVFDDPFRYVVAMPDGSVDEILPSDLDVLRA